VNARLLMAVLACLACHAPQAEAARKSRGPATLADLASRSAPVRPDQPVVADVGLAARSYEEFLGFRRPTRRCAPRRCGAWGTCG
jgi:hypothetical protein